MSYRAGEWVVVRSREEILATLDKAGELESMPFMEEMLQYCGKQFRVGAAAHKTCDTIHKTGGRRVKDAVHLEGLRCDGGGHGGCQAECLLFFKNAWLKPASGAAADTAPAQPASVTGNEVLRAAAVRTENGEPVYSCQATRLFAFTQPLAWWDLRQYAEDLTSGNVGVGRFLRVWLLRVIYSLRRIGIGFRASVAIYNFVHRVFTGRPDPYRVGLIPSGSPTPTGKLDLAVGEWVRVKSHDEIRATLTENNVNRGMRWDPEMTPFCGSHYKVSRRVERLIDERTGRMIPMKSPCIVLEGAVCTADYSDRRLFCPRAIPPYFREIWLDRTTAGASEAQNAGQGRAAS